MSTSQWHGCLARWILWLREVFQIYLFSPDLCSCNTVAASLSLSKTLVSSNALEEANWLLPCKQIIEIFENICAGQCCIIVRKRSCFRIRHRCCHVTGVVGVGQSRLLPQTCKSNFDSQILPISEIPWSTWWIRISDSTLADREAYRFWLSHGSKWIDESLNISPLVLYILFSR